MAKKRLPFVDPTGRPMIGFELFVDRIHKLSCQFEGGQWHRLQLLEAWDHYENRQAYALDDYDPFALQREPAEDVEDALAAIDLAREP